MNRYKEINDLPLTPSLAKVGVGGSNPLARSNYLSWLVHSLLHAQQGLVVGRAIALRSEDCGTPFAFRLGPDITHEAVDRDGKAHFVKPLDHDFDFVGLHRD